MRIFQVALPLRFFPEEGGSMNLVAYFISLLVAGSLMGSPAIGLGTVSSMSLDADRLEDGTAMMTMDESAQQPNPAKPLLVAVDYCYLGSIIDDSTGEILDLYGICDRGENFDVA
jgi:hypothetical protein